MTTNNIIAPANTADPIYNATRGSDRPTAGNANIANPCQDEFIGDINNQSPVVQMALQDAFDATSLPSGFPQVDMDNIISFYNDNNKSNDDVAALQEKAEVATAHSHGRMGDVVAITNIKDQASRANAQMWEIFKAEQSEQTTQNKT